MMPPDGLDLVASIRARRARVLETIAMAAARSNRPASSIRLVVVTKAQPLRMVQAAIAAGATLLGENYANEAVGKMQAVGSARSDSQSTGVEWHMIGHVQHRKAKLVAQHFALVHAVDSVHLARRLDAAAQERKRKLPVLLQFNVGGEPQKHGWPASDESSWPHLVTEVGGVADLPALTIRGLMTMPPFFDSPEDSRPFFIRLRRLQQFMQAELPNLDWSELSMGTSADYEVAVEEGATLVRVGQAILGPRPVMEHT